MANAAMCDGSSECKAERHLHGCFADYGNCDHPSEHGLAAAPAKDGTLLGLDEPSAALVCECGHPKDAHPVVLNGTHHPDRHCRTTVYVSVPNGMNAWPCPCRAFREAKSDA